MRLLALRDATRCCCLRVLPQPQGYPGDAGYAQAQVALMDHANDAVVTASVAAATTSLYARAGINLQEALKQAV